MEAAAPTLEQSLAFPDGIARDGDDNAGDVPYGIDDIDDYVTRNLKRSFVEETKDMTDAAFVSLKAAVIEAWQPFSEDGILQVPNYARLGIGWKIF